jgi:hypothetical protein
VQLVWTCNADLSYTDVMKNIDSSLHSVINYVTDKSKKTKALDYTGMDDIFSSIDYVKLRNPKYIFCYLFFTIDLRIFVSGP